MDDKIDDIDRVSGLPDFLLHRILSFLPRKDANQTCVLSKRWKYIWDTFPVFDFDQDIYIPDPIAFTPKYRKQAREFINFVDKSLQRFSCCNLLMEKLELRMRLIERNHFPMIDQWLELCLNLDSGVQEMRLMVKTGYSDDDDDDGIYTLPKTTFAAKSISGSSKLDRLQKLSLEFVYISESVIQNIVRNCHNLNHLYLQNICGLKTLKISKLNKLETVAIVSTGYLRDLESVNIDAPNLKYFRIDANGPKCCISLNSCYDLKELRLSGCGITDDLLHLYLSRFPFIEVLEISNCSLLRKFEISAQRLKSLGIFFGCLGVERIQVNAPTLSLFECMTFNKPVLIPENVPCLMKIVYAMHIVADSSWFSELRKSLGHLPQSKLVTVKIFPCKINFNLEELRKGEIPPLIEIDHLVLICCIMAPMNCEALIEGLLWSCHPKILSVPTHLMDQKDCIQILREKLLDRKHPTCCGSSHIKCWRHHLKNVKMESIIEDNRLLRSNLSLCPLPSLKKNRVIRFKLEWKF